MSATLTLDGLTPLAADCSQCGGQLVGVPADHEENPGEQPLRDCPGCFTWRGRVKSDDIPDGVEA